MKLQRKGTQMRLKGKVALVTGASGGLGRSICRALAREGAAVAVHYNRDAAGAEEAVAQITEDGGRAEPVQADLTDRSQVGSLIDRTVASLGGLDALVNNAGVTIGGRTVAETAAEDWDHVIDVNLNSVFYVCKAAIPHLRARGGGSVVNIASNIVNSLPGGSSAYAASKSAVVALTKVLSKEEARNGIRVNVISPGMIAAGMGLGAMERRTPEGREQFLNSIPMGREGSADEVAAVVAFLVSDEASYITGQNLNVNGGDRTESYR